MFDYDGRVFRVRHNSQNGDATSETLFLYHEENGVVWAEYGGGAIIKGMLLAHKAEDGSLNSRYRHVNVSGRLMTGKCNSVVTVLTDRRYRLHEAWWWTL